MLIKIFQTGLLVITGLTGFISSRNASLSWSNVLGLIGSLFFTIAGSTVLNMVYDHDLDALMHRTSQRPLPTGKISLVEACILGFGMSAIGLLWSFQLSILYGVVVFAGLFLDVLIYTFWLKRRTPWSVIWGGLSGGMPILAGRVLGLGQIDSIGVLLALSIVLWIPTHILTFHMVHFNDYQRACIPTFASKYGFRPARFIIIGSSIGAVFAIGMGCIALGLSWRYLQLLAVLTTGIIVLSVLYGIKPSNRNQFILFKYASLYMLGAMLIVMVGVYYQ